MNVTSSMYSHSNGAPIDTTTEYSSFIIVRDDCTGFVIGTKGATVKNIAKTTRTWIRIQPPNENSIGMPWFLIKGRSAEAVATAHHYIKTIATEALVRISESEALVKNSQSQDEQNIAEYWDATETDIGFCDSMIDLTKKEQRNYYGTDDIEQCYEIDAALTDFVSKYLERTVIDEVIIHLSLLSKDEFESIINLSNYNYMYNLKRLAYATDEEPWNFKYDLDGNGIPYIPLPKYTDEQREDMRVKIGIELVHFSSCY
jgi:hypothetical protein